jgi:hypothetical protein
LLRKSIFQITTASESKMDSYDSVAAHRESGDPNQLGGKYRKSMEGAFADGRSQKKIPGTNHSHK